MQLRELLQESTPFNLMKERQKAYADLGKNHDLVFVAGMGWPQPVKTGAWFGGGLKKRGRAGKEDKDDIVRPSDLPPEAKKKWEVAQRSEHMETRVNPFLDDLAKLLEKEMAAGNTVKLAGSVRSAGEVEVKPGEAAAKLKSTVAWQSPPGQSHWDAKTLPCVTWFVSNPAAMAGKMAVRLETAFTPTDGKYSDRKHVALGSSMDEKTAKLLNKKFNAWVKANQQETDWNDKSIKRPATKEWKAFVDRVHAAAKKAGFDIPAKHDYGNWASISLKVLTKATKVIDPDEFLAIFKGIV